MADKMFNLIELSEKHTYPEFNCFRVFQMMIFLCLKNESFSTDILMFAGVTYVTMLTILLKIIILTCRIKAVSNISSLRILSALVCQQQLFIA